MAIRRGEIVNRVSWLGRQMAEVCCHAAAPVWTTISHADCLFLKHTESKKETDLKGLPLVPLTGTHTCSPEGQSSRTENKKIVTEVNLQGQSAEKQCKK